MTDCINNINEKKYSNLIRVGDFFNNIDDYVILKLPETFPNYYDYSDIDILCRDRESFLNHILKVGEFYEKQGFRIEVTRAGQNLHVDFFPQGAKRLNLRLDLIDTLANYEKVIVGRHYTDVVLDSRQKIFLEGVDVMVPSLEHDLALRFLEYVEYIDKRPDKIKHWHYIQRYDNLDFIKVLKRYTNLNISMNHVDGKINLDVTKNEFINDGSEKKQRIDYFLIWGNGLQYTNQIIDIIRKQEDFEIINIERKNVNDIEKFVMDIYACDSVPLKHLISKTRYLLKTKPEIIFILIKNNNPKERYFGEGEFRHIQSQSIVETKEEIRNKFNPRVNNKRTEEHVIHASDYESQVEHVIKILKLQPLEYYTRCPNSDLDVPFHIKPFDNYVIKEIDIEKIYANILNVGTVPIAQTPHYKYLIGDKDAYRNYHNEHFGTKLTEDHFPEAFDRMVSDFKYDYITNEGKRSLILARQFEEGKYIILDGVHRAAILKNNSVKTVAIAEPLYQNKFEKVDTQKNRIAGLIFSKNRAMQLQAAIESFLLHCHDYNKIDLFVLYKTTNEPHIGHYNQLKRKFPNINFIEERDFKGQVDSIVRQYEKVMFLVDDSIFVKPFSISNVVNTLEEEKDAIGFSLRLGKNTTYCYPLSSHQKLPEFNQVKKGILKYYWPDAEHDFSYPLELSSSVYRCRDLLNLLTSEKITSPNTLESVMNKNKNKYHYVPYLMMFEESVAFANPVNVVQNEYANKYGLMKKYSSDELANYFSMGRVIDVSRYSGYTPDAAHKEVELFYKNTDISKNMIRSDFNVIAPSLPVIDIETKPGFSVVMANYNNSQYIEEAIYSVLNQTYQEWELIIIDDCSTDDSVNIIEKFLDDKRIRLIRHEQNKGYISALKTGIANIKSLYFGIMDSDDCLMPKALEVMHKQHVESPDCGMIYSQFIYCNKDIEPQKIGYCKKIPPDKTNLETDTVSHFKTFKLDDYLKTPGYDEDILYAEDKDISYKMEEVTRLKFVDECLYLYRVLPDSQGHDPYKASVGKQSMERAKRNALKRREHSRSMFEYLIDARKEFDKENFVLASEYINKYKSLVDYSKLDRKVNNDKNVVDVSVIIVTHNRMDELKKCLETIRCQDTENYEIIVVNNGGCDYKIIESFVDQYITCPANLNISEGRNIGVHFAKGNIVAFLDDDAIVEQGFVSSIKSAFRKYDIFGLRGRTLPKNNVDYIIGTNIFDLGKQAFPAYCNQEGNSAWLRDIYVSVEGMDPLLFGHEGCDLTYRIIKKYNEPCKIIYWPETIIYHNYPTAERIAPKKVRYERCNRYLKYKHNINIFINHKDIERFSIGSKQVVSNRNPSLPVETVSSPIYPKVSIVIACHNCDKYLPSCIESIHNQTMNDWELFLLDDGSSDNTKNIIKQFSRNDSRIKSYYFERNAGPYVRRNYAIERAESDFIVIQDSDDIMHPEKLEKLYKEITKEERLGVVGSFYLMTIDEFKNESYCDKIELPVTHDEIMKNYQSNLYVCWHGSSIIRKSLFETIGLYDEHSYGSDKFWLAKAAEYSRFTNRIQFKNIPEYLTYKIEHSLSQQGQLPNLDPRSRRAKFQTYWLHKLLKIRETVQNNPSIDIGSELRKCKCNDYISMYGHLFEQWENEKIDEGAISAYTNNAVDKFNEEKYVSCIITLDSIEKIGINIARKMKHYNLLRAMAYYAIGMQGRSLEYLELEIKAHGSPAANKFLKDGFSTRHIENIGKWCEDNSEKYDLSVIDVNTCHYLPAQDNMAKPYPICETNKMTISELPLVSVIIPAYNAAEYIADAIKSVLSQDYNNFELLIINDGSTDNTEQIIKSFKDNRIRYMSQENRGLAATHNTGIMESKGEYIIKLDCDDMMTSDFISKHVLQFIEHPDTDLVYCDDYLIDENAKPKRIIERQKYTDRNILIRDLFRNGFPVVPFRTCVKKSVFDKIGLFDEDLIIGEDYDMMRRFVREGLKMRHLKGALYLRRLNSKSLSRSCSHKKAEDLFNILDRYTKTFEYKELFPDIDWDQIMPGKEELYSKCLTAETLIGIGKTYLDSEATQIYAYLAFAKAKQQYEKCLEMEPDNPFIQKIIKQFVLDKVRVEENNTQTIS